MTDLARTHLFSPFTLRGVTIPNRVVVAPMQMYEADDGFANDWHLAHLGRFAMARAGLVFTEVLCVEPRGRSTYRDCGIWKDEHIAPLQRIAALLRRCGTVPGAQIGHCGPKAARQTPWAGLRPLGPADASRGEPPWTPVASTDEPSAEGYHVPEALSGAEIARVVDAFGQGARRCAEAGFDVLDVHAAHGYLIHTFLSPVSNKRADGYGGDLKGRMRFALEIAEAIRVHWPRDKPILFRLSCIDRYEAGWEMADTLVLAAALRDRGIDAIDCSSGGIRGANSLAAFDRVGGPPPGYQVPFAAEIRARLAMPTMAVGLITDPHHAEHILAEGQADLIAIAREALYDPNWPLHAAIALAVKQDNQRQFGYWPPNYGWWLQYREKQQARREAARG